MILLHTFQLLSFAAVRPWRGPLDIAAGGEGVREVEQVRRANRMLPSSGRSASVSPSSMQGIPQEEGAVSEAPGREGRGAEERGPREVQDGLHARGLQEAGSALYGLGCEGKEVTGPSGLDAFAQRFQNSSQSPAPSSSASSMNCCTTSTSRSSTDTAANRTGQGASVSRSKA